MSSNNPINYSKTQRILLLIDLTPLLGLENPKPYTTSLLSSAKTLLSFPPLSLSLSSFKFFISSLSPLISDSTLPKIFPFSPSFSPNSVSFNHVDKTLTSLSKALDSIAVTEKVVDPGFVSKASLTSSSVAQVLHDYAWDLCGDDDVDYVNGEGLIGVARSNVVVLFSPICRSFSSLCEYMDDYDLISKCEDDTFCDKFRKVFRHVRHAFVSRDIHFSWVDVRYELGHEINSKNWKLGDEYGKLLLLFCKGVNRLGWGFCSSSSIILGSAVVPFGLIYPQIGVSSSLCYDVVYDKHRKVSGQLNLVILDVNGKPLECKYCDLQLVDPNMLHGRRLDELSLSLESRKSGKESLRQISETFERFGNGIVKIDVKCLCRHSELVKIEEQIFDMVLVQELPIDSKKNKEESSRQFFADRVLDLLYAESSKSVKGKSPPLWQILLSFLYRRGYWALVSLSNADGSTTLGVLKPFTVHSALLCIPKNKADFQNSPLFGLNGLSLGECSSEMENKIRGYNGRKDSVSGVILKDGRSKNKKHHYKYKDLSWSSFCEAAIELREMELEEACFCGEFESSKKLKFLKCWMKQAVKNSSSFRCKPYLLQSRGKESEQPLAFPIRKNEPAQREVTTPLLSEASEAFFNNLSHRIQHGIESGVDLLAFAQRIVHSCMYWFSRKLDPQTNKEDHISSEKSNDSSCRWLIVNEVIRILLIEPKVVAGKLKDTDQSSNATTELNSSNISSENKIRAYELQILFRMEILHSELAVRIRETTEHKFVKEICSFLEFIQCSMEDGFFGDFHLSDYIEKIISDRYNQNFAGIVHRIYEQMDLLLFDAEDESPNVLLNSEESNQSWRIGINDGSEPNSTDDSFSGPSRNYEPTQKDTDHECKLLEAQERRQRASRLSSFTRRAMPELQRVWAPKPSKLSRSKAESFRRSKRKSCRETYDNVCETPMSVAKKCLFPSECAVGDLEASSPGVAKRVLFQDDPFQHDWRP